MVSESELARRHNNYSPMADRILLVEVTSVIDVALALCTGRS